jgi:hypothetical protein
MRFDLERISHPLEFLGAVVILRLRSAGKPAAT